MAKRIRKQKAFEILKDPLQIIQNMEDTLVRNERILNALLPQVFDSLNDEEYASAYAWANSLTQTNCWFIDYEIAQLFLAHERKEK